MIQDGLEYLNSRLIFGMMPGLASTRKLFHDVDLQIHDIEGTATSPAHENAALTFGILILQKIKSILGIAA